MDTPTITEFIAAADDATIVGARRGKAVVRGPRSAEPADIATPSQIIVIALGSTAVLYFARPVIMPILLAFIAAMTLKPVIRWLSCCRIPPVPSSAIVLCVLVSAIGFGFFELGRPALTWMNAAPRHMTEMRQRVQKMFPRFAGISEAAAAVVDLGATDEEKKEEQRKSPTVEVKDGRGASSLLTWTGSFLTGAGETLVLLFLLLASGDLFLQKLVRVMPTLHDQRSAVEISREVQQNISKYMFSVSLINICVGAVVSVGLYFMGVPNAAMWGMFVAVLNFVPYFGPVAGVIVLTAAGLLTIDTPWKVLLPPAWYLLIHLLEANLATPLLLGRKFKLNPVIIFVSLIFWTWLWGMPGALLSVPILVSIKVICDRLPSMSHVSELLAS